eukprot:TRINITY_DN15814_c0_g1_i2.p1 TRINITY_DN15814_c0_g1~~TRINITY_DN15814_c0_g1_i2.p1  ORF type:complete len:512 (-),score=139.77 TRINITY_DN15814_c0_g1_i2:93-1628(-)
MGCTVSTNNSPKAKKIAELKKTLGEGKTAVIKYDPPPASPWIAKQLASIEILPEQFILENNGNVSQSYTLHGKIGQGSFGVVYRATHNASGNIRAIKVLDRTKMSTEDQQKLNEEIGVLKKLDHPNIMKLFEVFTDAQNYYLVTEFIDGGELFGETQRRGIFAEKTAAAVMRQLLSVVMYCHKRGMVHRDLKPKNILISKDSDGNIANIKVIDFGAATAFAPNAVLRDMVGTPYYIAPEVLDKSYNEKCDVWSCGVILYILLSGCQPFSGKNPEEVMDKVREKKFRYCNPKMSPESKDLIDNMLKCPQESRFSAQQAYGHKWIRKNCDTSVNSETTRSLLSNLENFRIEKKLQQAVLMYIATQLISDKEKIRLQKAFEELDQDGDGQLSRGELIKGLTQLSESMSKADKDVELMLKNVAMEHRGSIHYSEFIVALMDKRKVLTDGNVRQSFELLDKAKRGFVGKEDVREVLGANKNLPDEVWEQVIKEANQKMDGKLTFDEFTHMMSECIA